MNFEEALTEYRKGKKIRRHCWLITLSQHTHYTKATTLLHNAVMADDWEVIEEPKPPRLMAPCLYGSTHTARIVLSDTLYSSMEAAKKDFPIVKQWPAIPDANGFYSVEQD